MHSWGTVGIPPSAATLRPAGIGTQPCRALSVVAMRVAMHGARDRCPPVGNSSIIPEAFESVRRHGSVAHGMLDVLMAQRI